jgi:hypothetical protein
VTGYTISVDARVLLALHEVPDSEPIERIAEHAGVSFDDMRASMRRLALRDTLGPMALGCT